MGGIGSAARGSARKRCKLRFLVDGGTLLRAFRAFTDLTTAARSAVKKAVKVEIKRSRTGSRERLVQSGAVPLAGFAIYMIASSAAAANMSP